MDSTEKKKLFGYIRYATLENTWFSLLIVIILYGALFLACIAIGLILERAGASTDVLRWITPTAYLAWLAIRARMIVRAYRSALRNVKIWLQFLGAAAIAVFAAQIDPWWLGAVMFFGVLTTFEFINVLVILGRENEPLFRRHSNTNRDADGDSP